MLKINKSNYECYKHISKVIWEFQAKCANIDPNLEYSPINVLTKWEKESESLARRGLREGLLDTLTGIKDLPPIYMNELNEKLISKNLTTIGILTSQIRNLPKKVIEKGKIKNLNEYYVIKEVLDDMEYQINESERIELTKIFGDFEKNYNGKNDS